MAVGKGAGPKSSIFVLDDGVWAVSAAGSFRVPLALLILVLDGFRVAGNFLLLGSRPRGGECLGMGRKGFGKHAVDLIGPAAVVLDNLISDVRHGTPFGFVAGLRLRPLLQEMANFRQQLAWAKRFRHIVIAAGRSCLLSFAAERVRR